MMLHVRRVHVHVDAETVRVVAVAAAPDTAFVTGVSKKFYVPELFPRVVVVSSTTRRHEGHKNLKPNSLRLILKKGARTTCLTHKLLALLPMLLHFPHVDVDAAVQVARVVAVAAAPVASN